MRKYAERLAGLDALELLLQSNEDEPRIGVFIVLHAL